VRTFVSAALACAAIALTAPARADAPQASEAPLPPARPTAVTLWVDGGFSSQNRWLQFRADGDARVAGMFMLESGRYRSRVDYARVERVLTEAGVCTRKGLPLSRPAGMDMFYYKVLVSCTDGVRYFTSVAGSPVTPDMVAVHDVIAGLERIGAQLDWEPIAETGAGAP
jgi:hypothetical protein